MCDDYNETRSVTMKTKLVQIGNSKGVRIPKPLIEQYGLSEDIELVLKDNEIILRPVNEPRIGWDHQFQKMAEHGDDQLLDPESAESESHWDETEWTW